uniref:Sulfotransferase n=1 Tax=Brassica oleracea TaxID=3712 RepID=A0A3P6A7T7_BRAOL|nr:unnamed protein product [Brassica oleracea]
MPLHTLKEGLNGSPCKIVFMCRNAKDALISMWYFVCKYQRVEASRSILESLFESLCSGVTFYGPFWDQVLSYWRGSLEDPSRVLFMNLSDLEINKSGKNVNGVDYKFYFRKGEVCDWKNHLTPEMERRIDMIIEEKLKGSGLSF